MRVGGTLLLGIGIIIVVLVANGRWDNVWNAALGTSTFVNPYQGGGFGESNISSGGLVNGLSSSGSTFGGNGGSAPGGGSLHRSGPTRG
jgi:hypothetical protein